MDVKEDELRDTCHSLSGRDSIHKMKTGSRKLVVKAVPLSWWVKGTCDAINRLSCSCFSVVCLFLTRLWI